jgi:hypothetical protein
LDIQRSTVHPIAPFTSSSGSGSAVVAEVDNANEPYAMYRGYAKGGNNFRSL